jgi:hypothetical protein
LVELLAELCLPADLLLDDDGVRRARGYALAQECIPDFERDVGFPDRVAAP